MSTQKMIGLIGNPNVGKTTLFNLLTGLKQNVANFPGVTVEKKTGKITFKDGTKADIVDLPGTYSLSAYSPDQVIVVDVLLGQQQDIANLDAIIAIVDGSNLERNLYLISQILELNIPMVIALNMQDETSKKGMKINVSKLSEILGCPVVETIAKKNLGIDHLLSSLQATITHPPKREKVFFSDIVDQSLTKLKNFLDAKKDTIGREVHHVELLRILLDSESLYCDRMVDLLGDDFSKFHRELCSGFNSELERISIEAETRYREIDEIVTQCVTQEAISMSINNKIDRILTHPLSGTIIFFLVMLFVFQAIYSWSGPLMDIVDNSFGWLGDTAGSYLPEGTLQSLIVDGIIGGIGAVLIFLPQILVLFAFIAILEDCGYMARAAFLMDRTMKFAGLSGHSFIPMLSSFACAIPGVMATRVIKNRRDRLITILIAPLMSCSARLPVYTIMIGAFIPAHTYFGGVLGLQGMVLFAMYLVGIVVAFPIAWILKKTFLKGPPAEFVMEMPGYKIPHLPTILMKMYLSGKAFVVNAGTFIFLVTVVVWALAYFPRSQEIEAQFTTTQEQFEEQLELSKTNFWPKIAPEKHEEMQKDLDILNDTDEESYENIFADIQKKYPDDFISIQEFQMNYEQIQEQINRNDQLKSGAHLSNSVLGRMGSYIEPLVRPLGWNWKIGVATIASFPAREVIIATLGIIYNLGAEEDEESSSLRTEMQNDTWPDGSLVFTPLVAISIMVFFALCCQCGATLGVIWRETNSIRWPVFTFVYMTVLAYVASLFIYQGGKFLGW